MNDLDLLLSTLRQAGALALRYHGKSPKMWNKPDGTVVTEADIAVDTFLKTTILTSRPDDGWLSEESEDTPERLTKSRLWIADPIDGTRAFADGTRFWGIGMALVENGAPVLSGIYCPVDDVIVSCSQRRRRISQWRETDVAGKWWACHCAKACDIGCGARGASDADQLELAIAASICIGCGGTYPCCDFHWQQAGLGPCGWCVAGDRVPAAQ